MTFRVVTLNLWGDSPPLDRRMALVTDGLRALAPDAVALQEVREIAGALDNQAATIARALGMQHAYALATQGGNPGGGEEGLAILSRHPIAHVDHRELPHARRDERRIVLGAALKTPSGELPLFTTHLHYRLSDGAAREDQVEALDAFCAEWTAARPTALPKILLGDFNARPESDEIRFLRGLHTHAERRAYWQDAWAACNGDAPGITWAKKNSHTEKLHFLDRDRRIDYIFVSPQRRDGSATVEKCALALDAPDEGGIFPSDHFAVCADVRVV